MRAGKGFTLQHIKPLEMDAVDSKFRPHHGEDEGASGSCTLAVR